MDPWSEGSWWGYCRTCWPDGVTTGGYEWIEAGICSEGHDDCVPLARSAYCLECGEIVPLKRDGTCKQGHGREFIHHHELQQTDAWPHPAEHYFDDAAPGGLVYNVWHPWTYMYYDAADVIGGRAATYAYRTRDGYWRNGSGHWGKEFPHATKAADALPQWMTELLRDEPRARAGHARAKAAREAAASGSGVTEPGAAGGQRRAGVFALPSTTPGRVSAWLALLVVVLISIMATLGESLGEAPRAIMAALTLTSVLATAVSGVVAIAMRRERSAFVLVPTAITVLLVLNELIQQMQAP